MSGDDEPQFTPIPMRDLEFPKILDVLMERKDRMYREWAMAFGVPAEYLSPINDRREREREREAESERA